MKEIAEAQHIALNAVLLQLLTTKKRTNFFLQIDEIAKKIEHFHSIDPLALHKFIHGKSICTEDHDVVGILFQTDKS